MHLQRTLAAAALLAAICLPAAAIQTGPNTSICIGGVARGDWNLPGPTAANLGFVDGELFLGTSTTVRYQLGGTLTPSPAACVACTRTPSTHVVLPAVISSTCSKPRRSSQRPRPAGTISRVPAGSNRSEGRWR